MVKLTFIFFPFILYTYSSTAQEIISIHDFNYSKLELKIKNSIDSLRISRRLPVLKWDSILNMAARDQSFYMNSKKTSTHEQKWSRKKTPLKRIKFYKGKGYTPGENVAYIPLYSPIRSSKAKSSAIEYVKTYDQAAKIIINSWLNSPGHFKNIINSDYALTGVGVSIDINSHLIYATQVFSNYNNKSNNSNTALSDSSLGFIKYRKKDIKNKRRSLEYQELQNHRLLNYETSCRSCELDLGRGTTVNFIGDKIILSTFYGSLKLIKMLRNRNIGFAAEIVNYSQYSTNNNDWYLKPTRRNESSIKNGRISKPIYRKQIIRQLYSSDPFLQNRILLKNLLKGVIDSSNIFPLQISIQIGSVPKGFVPSGLNEINYLVVKDKKICFVSHGTGNCGEDFKHHYKLEYLPSFSYEPIKIEKTLDSVSFEIPFDRNSYTFDEQLFGHYILNKGLTSKGIKDATAIIHASIEGTNTVNHSLLLKRTENISKFVREYLKNVNLQIDTTIAWHSFYAELKRNKKFKSWLTLNKEDLQYKLQNEQIPNAIDSILFNTRKTSLIIRYWTYPEDTINFLFQKLKNNLLKINNNNSISAPALRELNSIFTRLYLFSRDGKFDLNELLKIEIPLKSELIDLINNQNYLILTHSKILSDNDLKYLYNQLKLIGNEIKKWKHNEAIYNLINFTIENYDLKYNSFIELERMSDLFESIDKINRDSLGINLHFLKSWIYGKTKRSWIKRDLSNNYLFNVFSGKEIDEKLALKLADKFLFAFRSDYAAAILKPHTQKKNPNLELLVKYLKASYLHMEDAKFSCLESSEYLNEIIKAAKFIPKEAWCGIFAGKCNTSFQALDFKEIRKVYCEICNERDDFILKGKVIN